MTDTEKLHQLIQALPRDKIAKVLHFAESLQQEQQGIAQRKEPNRLFLFLSLAVILAFAIPIIPYVFNFASQGISPSPDDWASFGDYLGGTANSILSFINLALVAWLSFRVFQLETNFSLEIFKKETEREKTLQSLSVKPICSIYPSDYENRIEVALINKGLGPGKITKLDFLYPSSVGNKLERYNNLIDLMPRRPKGLTFADWHVGIKNVYLPVGDHISLILLEGSTDNPLFTEYRDQVREILKDVRFDFEYSNMFDEVIGGGMFIFPYYGRHTK